MDDVSRYGYINAKLRAKVGSIRSSETIEAMIKAPTLNEAVATLANTPHARLAEVYDKTADIQQVELEMTREEIESHREIIKALDGPAADFITVSLERIEVENIKNAVRLWYASAVMSHRMGYRASYIVKGKIVHDIDWTGVVNALGWDEVSACFRDTPWAPAFEKVTNDTIREGVFGFEIALDHLWFNRVFDGIGRLPAKDRGVALKIHMVDVDLKNVLNLIRYGYFHGMDSSGLSEILIARGSLYEALRSKSKDSLVSFKEAAEIIGRRYPKVRELMAAMEQRGEASGSHTELAYGAIGIENYLAERRRKEYNSILAGDPFTIGTALSYLFLRRWEHTRIKGVLSAKYYKWSEERIRRELN